MPRRAVALAAATLIGIAGATAARLFRRRSPAGRPPVVRSPSPPSGSAPIRVLDVGIRTPPRQPVPLGLLSRVVLSPLALLAALVRLRRRFSRTDR